MITRFDATHYRSIEHLGADTRRYCGDKSLCQHLADNHCWPIIAAKPARSKEAAEWVSRQARRPRSSASYQAVAEHISIRDCTDTAFFEMHTAFFAWFPVKVVA